MTYLFRTLFTISLAAQLIGGANTTGDELETGVPVPTGKMLTPTAARGAIFQNLKPGLAASPEMHVSQAAGVSVSPDGQTLAILTSGYNRHYGKDGKPVPELSTEFVFLFDISGPRPKQMQALPVPNTYQGLTWASSDKVFASGGMDDTVVEFVRNDAAFSPGRTIHLGHKTGIGLNARPVTGAVAASPDGTRLLVTNFQNDSVSLIDIASGRVVAEQDLRPGIVDPKHRGEPGGSFPRCVVWSSSNHAYVGSERDREIVSLAISGTKMRVTRRIRVHGQPVALVANRKGTRLYAALDNTDQVAIIDATRDALIEEFNAVAPEAIYPNAHKLSGANSNALALTQSEDMLLVSNGGANSIAVVQLSARARGAARDRKKEPDGDDERSTENDRSAVVALAPTGWYPTGVATSKDGAHWYVVNGKSPTGPNVSWCKDVDPAKKTCVTYNPPGEHFAENGNTMLSLHDQTTLQIEEAGFLTIPAPSPRELGRLTKQVARNNHYDHPETEAKDEQIFAFLREHIKHVIYIIKENRTYDQILGDLEIGNGDPRMAIFPEKISPNHHKIARDFGTLDNFFVSGEGSWTGWQWSVAARTSDFAERGDPMGLAGRGVFGGHFAVDRSINTSYATSEERKAHYPASPADPDILPGLRDVGELDGPGGEEGKGYIWDAVLRRGLTVRSYGVFGDDTIEFADPPVIPDVREPFTAHTQVFFPTSISMKAFTDPYFRGWHPMFPDYWRYREWKREFDGFCASKNAPNLMVVRLGGDHTGNFATALDGVNTPETQMADNDYALGLLLEAVANSPFGNDTVVISIEDDTWDGPDHVNSFRSLTLVAGPYVRRHAVVSTRYTTVSVIKTIEELLGTGPIGLNDALAAPMSDVFDPAAATWSYKAIVPDVLRSTKLPLPPEKTACIATPKRSSAYWAKVMAGQDFSGADRVDPVSFNRALWRGLKGNEPYPTFPTGADLRRNRSHLLVETKPAPNETCTVR